MNKKILILIIGMFMLALPVAFSVELSDLTDFVVQDIRFDGDIITDSSIYNNEGTVTGTPVLDSVIFKLGTGSAKFTGNGHIEFPNIVAYELGNKNYTVSFWGKFDDTTTSTVWDRSVNFATDGDVTIELEISEDALLFVTFSTGNIKNLAKCQGVVSNTWILYTLVNNITGGTAYKYLYTGETICASQTHTSNIASSTQPIWLGERSDGGNDANLLYLDGVVYSNKSWTGEEVSFYWNNNTGLILEVPDITPLTSFSITAKDLYDDVSLNNITVIISNSSFSFNQSTQNGTILVLNSSFKFNESYDIKFLSNESGGYFNITFNNIRISTGKIIEGTLFQSILRVNATEVITNNTITSFTVNVPLQSNISNSSGFSTLHLRAGDYNISMVAAGFITGHTNISISPLEDRTLTMILGTSNLTITALGSGGTVNNFNTTMTLLTTGFAETKDTTNGKVVFSTIAGVFNVTLNASGFAFTHQSIIIAAGNRFPNITFNLFSENSINITIFDEESNEIIDFTTVTLILDHISQRFTNTTNTGNSFFINLFDGLWNLLASTSIHAQRGYIFTIVPQSTSSLNVYLLNSSNGEVKTFTVKNKRDQSLTGSTISISNKINDTFVTVAQRVTDFAGQANIFLSSTNSYRFTVEASGFTTKVFDLTPVVSSYNIIMDSLDTIKFTTIFNDVTFTILPVNNIIIPSDFQNISIITSAPSGMITYFGLNSSFNNTDRLTNVSGSPAGGTASISINTSAFNSTAIDVDFFIKINGEPIITIHRVYRTAASKTPIGNASAISVADKYRDSFTSVGKSLIIVILAVGIILSLAEVGAPAVIHGAAGAMVIIFGVIIRWIPITIGIVVGFVLISMYVMRGLKE